MARNMNRETLEQKIAKTEKAISRNREQDDRLTAELEDMHKKKKAILNEEILKAIAGSGKSYEEILTLLDERHPERKIERAKQALYDAYVESERSLDEIIDLIRNADEWIQAGFSCKISGSSHNSSFVNI